MRLRIIRVIAKNRLPLSNYAVMKCPSRERFHIREHGKLTLPYLGYELLVYHKAVATRLHATGITAIG